MGEQQENLVSLKQENLLSFYIKNLERVYLCFLLNDIKQKPRERKLWRLRGRVVRAGAVENGVREPT